LTQKKIEHKTFLIETKILEFGEVKIKPVDGNYWTASHDIIKSGASPRQRLFMVDLGQVQKSLTVDANWRQQ